MVTDAADLILAKRNNNMSNAVKHSFSLVLHFPQIRLKATNDATLYIRVVRIQTDQRKYAFLLKNMSCWKVQRENGQEKNHSTLL